MKKVYIRDLDVIYLSYDEPQKEEFWSKILNIVPWAKRIDSIKGSDNAHKAAALSSDTNRFVVIDGDNLPDPKFFDDALILDNETEKVQFRWRAKNNINNLYYGNGGLSCWTKDFVLNMKTHENTDGSNETLIEFCFDRYYWPMHDCYSTTYPNYSPKQAWRAGFREGVKLCTRNGVPNRDIRYFKDWVWQSNMHKLMIWQTIGMDVENGFYAMLGARTGLHYLMLNPSWDYTDVREFDKLDSLWDKHRNDSFDTLKSISKDLNRYLGIDLVEYDSNQSKFFKTYSTNNWVNTGIMEREKF